MQKTVDPSNCAASCNTRITIITSRGDGLTSLGHHDSEMDSFKGKTLMPSSSHNSCLGAPASLVHLALSGSSGLQTDPHEAQQKGTKGMLEQLTVQPLSMNPSDSCKYFSCTGRKDFRWDCSTICTGMSALYLVPNMRKLNNSWSRYPCSRAS